MEIVRIQDNNSNIILYFDKYKYFGYQFNNDNTIFKVNKNIFKYFDFLVCSNNYSLLPNENDYKVILDNDTNFKHYFKGGSEDYQMFFLNNGIDAISYSKKENKNKNSKAFFIGSLIVTISLQSLITISCYHVGMAIDKYNNNYEEISIEKEKQDEVISLITDQDISIVTIINAINNSPYLTSNEKKYLIQADFINDAMEYINVYNYTKADILNSIENISIKSFDNETDLNSSVIGFYDELDPNVIHARDYSGIDVLNKDTIAHEYIHLFQAKGAHKYNLITEASAEIISDEYYEDTKINAYFQQVNLLKKLMEIIGPTPIWHYNFTGDFSLVEENVKPYLSDDEYQTFLNCLHFNYEDPEQTMKKCYELDSVLNVLYKNKYNLNAKDDLIINLIDNNVNMKRYYFNKKYINKDNSYYYDPELSTSLLMSKDEAILNDYVHVYIDALETIDSKDVFEFKNNNPDKSISVNNKYNSNFKQTAISFTSEGIKISGYYNGEFINSMSEDELKQKGILLESKYCFIKETKKLSNEEYFNNEFDDSESLRYIINLNKINDAIFKDGGVEVFIPTKTLIPTINERFENIKNR